MNNLLFVFIFVPILAAVLLALNILLAPHKPDFQKVSQYECGFAPIPGQTRSTFQIHFMIVALLFLIFDLEILLLFPLAVSLYQISIFGFTVGIIFFIILTVGFVLEIGSGAIALTNLNGINNPTPGQDSPNYYR
jgi:NADH-ubiquinone oxidoreductase chain 3